MGPALLHETLFRCPLPTGFEFIDKNSEEVL
jgi:hypothetical protein